MIILLCVKHTGGAKVTQYIQYAGESFEVSKKGMLCMVTPMINLEAFEDILESKSNKAWNASVEIVKEQMTATTREKVGNFCLRFKVEDQNHAKRIASAFLAYSKKTEDAKLSRVFAKRAAKITAWIAFLNQ